LKIKWAIADLNQYFLFFIKAVKEQRVDGSCTGYNPKLRDTLMGGESCYRIRIPSKQLNNLSYSTLNLKNKLNPLLLA
jgi:hypothetical protein